MPDCTLPGYACSQCPHKWITDSNKPRPRHCAKCHSRRWDEPIQAEDTPKRASTALIETDARVTNTHIEPVQSVSNGHVERKLNSMPKGSGKMPKRKPVK